MSNVRIYSNSVFLAILLLFTEVFVIVSYSSFANIAFDTRLSIFRKSINANPAKKATTK